MKQLTCEMCGSTDLLKSDGIFVCQSCGCKYSVEEAKKLMVEGTVTVSGSVHADSSHLVTNYFNIARNAYNSGNKAEAEDYCNKIIEVNPGSSEAWLLKGKAAGWQSTLGNIRFAEAINCFANAIQYAAEEKKESLVEECKDEIRNLSEALIRLRGERFQKFPDAAEYAGFSNDVNVIFRAIIQFFTATNVLIDKDTLVSPLSTIINNAVMASWKNVVVPEYANDNEGYPDDYEFERLIERAGYCTKLLELAINLCDTDDVSDIERYQNLIVIHQYMIDACSYQYKTVKVGNSNWDGSAIYENRYVRSKTLTEAAKAERRAQIAKYEAKFMAIRKADIDAKRAKEKKEREDAYNSFWTAHASEKKALTAELAELKNKKLILEKAHTGHKQIQMIEQRITQIEDVLKKDRRDGNKDMSNAEQALLTGKAVFWDKLKKTEDYDAYLDRYPILKEKEELIKKVAELKRELPTIRFSPPKYWGMWIFFAILHIIAPLIVFVFCLLRDYDLQLARPYVRPYVLFCLALAFLSVSGGIRNFFKYRFRVFQLKYELKECNKKLELIDRIPAYSEDKTANASSFAAYDQKVEDEKRAKTLKKKKMRILLISIAIAIIAGLFVYYLIL